MSAQHQRQEHHQDKMKWVPTPFTLDPKPIPDAYGIPDRPSKDAALSYNDSWLDPKLTPHLLYQPSTPILDSADLTPQPEYSRYNMANEYDECVILLDGCKPNNGANMEPECDNTIKQLVHKLVIFDDAMGGWAEEMEGIGSTQGEYTQAGCSPSPSSPSPALQYQPPPPHYHLPTLSHQL